MSLIRIKNRLLPSIGTLHWLAAKYIFERHNFTREDAVVLEEGITQWTKKIDLSADERWELKRIANALLADEKGHFNRSKELQREHKIDYKKMYKAGLPFVDVDNRKFFNKG